MSFILRPAAEDDIQQIAEHIATDNPGAARNWRLEIMEVCRMLGDLPDLGTGRDNLPHSLKTFPKGRYIIVFKSLESGVIIIRVVHSARNWPKLIR